MRRTLRPTLVFFFVVAAAIPAARAGGVDWSASIGLSAGDDTYLNLNLSHFQRDGDEALVVARRLPHPETDLPVLLFLARESGRPLNSVLDLRLRGLSWWEIRARLGVPPERVIVVLPHDPGPPYGKAHGHYKHKKHHAHHRNRKHTGQHTATVVISDTEFADWVGVRVLSSAYGVEPAAVLEARRAGISLAEFTVTREKARRRARSHGGSHADAHDRHHDRDRHHGHDHGHGDRHGKKDDGR